MLQRHILYVAKTKFICCKDKIYMLQRQNLYVAKTTFICCKDKMYMLQRQNLYVIQLPSASPPPCPLVLLEHRWPAALGDNSVLCLELCRPKMAKNNTECWPFFAFSFLRSSACMGSKHHQNLVQKLHKRGKNGGLGWCWGLLGELLEAFGPQHGPSSEKLEKVSPSTPSQGPPGLP